jgi:hypothetical protein
MMIYNFFILEIRSHARPRRHSCALFRPNEEWTLAFHCSGATADSDDARDCMDADELGLEVGG